MQYIGIDIHKKYGAYTTLGDDGRVMDQSRIDNDPVLIHEHLNKFILLFPAVLPQGYLVYFEYPGQDHNFKNPGWDVISKRTIEFFDRYLKPDKE